MNANDLLHPTLEFYDEKIVGTFEGIRLIHYMAIHAPAAEIAELCPTSPAEAAAFLGVPLSEYVGAVHYPRVLAKLRYQWAHAMIEEGNKHI